MPEKAEGTYPSVIPEDPPPVNQLDEKSWVKVVKKKQGLTKYDVDLKFSDGKHTVEVPMEVVEKSNHLWDDFVIARFLETAPHIAKVHMIVNKIWAFGEKSQRLDVHEMDEKTMRIRITNEKIREKVIRRGMWNIAGVPMVVSKWSPEAKDSTAQIPLWVHLTNVPLSMYSWEGLSFMTSPLGVPDHLHPETIACSNFDVAKVFVQADLSKELPTKIEFMIQGEKVIVEYAYPWLPPKCTSCGKWGHYVTFCKDQKKVVEKEISSPLEGTQSKEKMNEELRNEKIEGKVDENESGTIKEARNDNANEGKKSAEGKSEAKEGELSTPEAGEIEWKKVSGEKAEKSFKPQSLTYGHVTIATPSRFDALRNTNEKGEEMEIEQLEETEEMRSEEADDVYQSMVEENVEASKKGRVRQILPRLSKTNHSVVIPGTSDHIKDMKRGSRKHH